MKTAELKSILQSPYSRKSWISTLQFLSGKRDLVTINLSPIEIDINTKEANKIVDQFHQIGSVKTTDNITLPIFEIILNKDIKIEHNRVAVNEFIKKHIIKDAIKGALVTFSYANVETEDDLLIFNADSSSKSEWRFSFISKNAANDFFAEAIGKETNPKKFTYIFGNNEAHRTAIERLYNLEQSRFTLDDFFDAFNVEPVSKKFFDEYKLIYNELATYIYNEEEYRKIFVKISTNDEKTKKAIRSFVGRLMGRIVFLYFLQKKNWLGATNTEFIDGSTSFLSDLFKNDVVNQSDFYSKYLCPIFFKALNENRGEGQEFKLVNGNTVCIPFLNGGLFEEDQEPSGHSTIKFRKSDFNRIFDFFNSYNFTVYENSPEEHTIAVDPEMLGHIFENLIDYNKDTGTFYTPKEIVQYMTQESLIEYLNTNANIIRLDIELLVKNQYADNISDNDLKIIDKYLDSVKICDPAIGSGAFPVGMLQEIFNLKALINYRLKDKEWNPADIKQNIIQNSIYGVDIDSGAVEIARLRFWLSLVIDEGLPKPLPNLDFKIVVANSLNSKYDLKININSVFNDFNNKINNDEIKDSKILDIVGNDTIDVDFYKKIVNEYLVESDYHKKIAFKKLINAIKESFNSTLDYKHQKRLSDARGALYNLEQKDIFGVVKGSKKDIAEAKKSLRNLEEEKKNILNDEVYKNALEWRFEFPQLLDDEANFIGFDIVIGNPPYIQLQKDSGKLANELVNLKYETFERTGDIYTIFYERGINLLNEKGVLCYITSNKWMRSNYGGSLRSYFVENTKPLLLVDFGNVPVFKTATVDANILLLKRKKSHNNYIPTIGAKLKKDFILNSNSLTNFVKEYGYELTSLSKNSWVIGEKDLYNIKENVEAIGIPLKDWNLEINRGLVTGFNEAFVIDSKTKEELISQDSKNTEIIKPIIRGKDIQSWYPKESNLWLINSHNGIKSKGVSPINVQKDYPSIYQWFLKYEQQLIKRQDKGNHWSNLRNCAYLEDFTKPKIMYRDITQNFDFAYVEEEMYSNNTVYMFSGELLKYLTCVLNSSLFTFCFKDNFTDLGSKGRRLFTTFFQEIPIKKIEENQEKPFNLVVDILVELKKQKLKDPNDLFMVVYFEQIADGLVYEMYFKESFEKYNLSIYNNLFDEHIILNSNEPKDSLIEIRRLFIKLYDESNPVRQSVSQMLSIPQINLIKNSLEQ